ncbi:MAG: phosphatidate cytidylyltransferase [Rhizobacter sp.]|nr:phosphatidate cytidylyltransferase [Ferruginibacter sp.]
MLIGLFTNVWTFLSLFFIIMIGCLVEYVRLVLKTGYPTSLWLLLAGPVYIVFPILCMIDLGTAGSLFTTGQAGDRRVTEVWSPLIPIAIIFSIWINDTMAYIVGSMIGKTPFSKISPKKTWEGTAGGAILCIIVIALLGAFLPAAQSIPVKHWVAIGALCAVFGTIGDLLESKLKRMANVKDSGSFMPGHGGFLDRFDSLLLAAPAVWLYVYFSNL